MVCMAYSLLLCQITGSSKDNYDSVLLELQGSEFNTTSCQLTESKATQHAMIKSNPEWKNWFAWVVRSPALPLLLQAFGMVGGRWDDS